MFEIEDYFYDRLKPHERISAAAGATEDLFNYICMQNNTRMARLVNVELINKDIKISSSNVKDNKGENAASGVWTSESYCKEAAEAEKK